MSLIITITCDFCKTNSCTIESLHDAECGAGMPEGWDSGRILSDAEHLCPDCARDYKANEMRVFTEAKEALNKKRAAEQGQPKSEEAATLSPLIFLPDFVIPGYSESEVAEILERANPDEVEKLLVASAGE